MATDSFSARPAVVTVDEYELLKQVPGFVRAVLQPIASLRLTVTLFAMAIFIIFVGTLAQVDKDMWEVIAQYFRSYFAWIEFQVFLPRSWFPSLADRVPGGFWFPGGFLIGAAMAVNLLAAHLVRFKIQAKGPVLTFGLLIIGLGTLVTYWVVVSGHNQEGLQGQPAFSWETFWISLKLFLAAVAIISGGAAARFHQQLTSAQRKGLVVLGLSSGCLAVWLFAKGDAAMPSASSLRILWQLIQGGMAGIVLLVGCLLVFKKRAGVVLLHVGVGLMMFSEFFVSEYAVEGRMTIREGETVNYVRDIRNVELAIVDGTAEDEDVVIAVPAARLLPGKVLADDQLPFDIHVEEVIENADLRRIREGEENYADSGSGVVWKAEPLRASSGTDSGQVDMAAMYVEFRKKGQSESLGKYMLSQVQASLDQPEEIDVGDQHYDVSLRFKRDYKPYHVSLTDVRKDDYLGTNTPMNYSSDVRLVDEGRKIDREFKIWMNNPLRYAGETFYQSGYNVDRDGSEITDLQVVTNTGWMMPYVGCMLVTVGMLVHFSGTLARFVSRQKRADVPENAETGGWLDWAIPAGVVLISLIYVGSKMRPPTDMKAGMRIHEFGQLPVIYQGRVKPLDTLARNSLRIVSNKETFEDQEGQQQPAIRWLLDVISGSEDADRHRVFRIDNLDVLETMGLTRRKGFRYAESEFIDRIDQLQKQIDEARQLDVTEMSLYHRKLLETETRIRAVRLLEAAFTPMPFPAMPTEREFNEEPDVAKARLDRIKELLLSTPQMQEMLARMQPPLAVPVGGDQQWMPYATAWNDAYLANIRGQEIPAATIAWTKMLAAYGEGHTKEFNDAVTEYHTLLDEDPPGAVAEAKVPFEFFFNYAQPFKYSLVLYIMAFVLVALGWLATYLGKFSLFNRTAFWLIVFTLCLHTFALGARIAISGRPPVTNLYSSAVFIGWGAVGLGLVLEWFYRLGIGNAIAAVSGFSTLFIAYALAADGDTFTVLQAVLDTQFWLATHVVCVTLGYSTTFVAGLLGAVYLIFQAQRFPKVAKALTSMTYGTLCFAIYFSFVGTVLGGLWADDSWGRFWGWDPKENGALMIVLWNALILHARWGGIVRQGGLAILAVLGNIVTAWSWFGVNELGVGLHSYGFTEGVLRNLGLFVLSQLAIVCFGLAAMYLGAGTGGQDKTSAA